MKALKITIVVLVCLIGLVCGLLCMQREWIEPRPGVRLAPARPVLRLDDVPPGSGYDLLCRATAFASGGPEVPDGTEASATNDWSDAVLSNVVAVLAAYSNQLKLARCAAAAPAGQAPTFLSYDDFRIPFVGVRNLVRLFRLSALRCAAAGDHAGACAELIAGIRCGDILSRGGPVISRMMDIACTLLACETLAAVAGRDDLPEPVAAATIAELAGIEEALEPWAEGVRHEYVVATNCVALVYSDPTALGVGGPVWPAAFALGRVLGSTPESTRRTISACYSHVIYLAEHPLDLAAQRAYEARHVAPSSLPGTLRYRDPIGRLMVQMVIMDLASMNRRHLERLFALRATRVFLAATLYRREHGGFPASLDVLVPRYLAMIPDDPFNGRALKVRAGTSGTAWAVYSVGEDRKDDGGTGTFSMSTVGSDLVLAARRSP